MILSTPFEGETNCPIGNYCSQWFGNFYLTASDNYILHDLKCGEYIRYCDDFLLFSNDKQYLNECKKKIGIFLKERLKLEFSKAEVFNTKQGVDFCGYRHFKKYLLLRKSTTKRMKKKLKQTLTSSEKRIRKQSRIASYEGQMKHCCSYNLRQTLEIDKIKQLYK